MGIVTRMVALPITIFFVLAAIITGGVLGISEPPDGFLRPRPRLRHLMSRLPEGAAQPRGREVPINSMRR